MPADPLLCCQDTSESTVMSTLA